MPRKDGTTLRQHLEKAEKATGKELVEEPDVPEEAEYIWLWFWELDSGRGGNGFGLNPLGWAEIAAWAGLTGNAPDEWEVRVLKQMDAARLNATEKVK